MTAILGISAFYHDSSAALLVDGQIVAAVQEERFSRLKNDAGYPVQSINYCLSAAGLKLSEIDHIVFYEKPFLKFERLLDTYLAFAPSGVRSFGRAIPVWIKEKLFQKSVLLKQFVQHDPDWQDKGQLKFSEHHMSHCASAFFPSPYEEAIVLSIDGVGERTTTSVAIGRGNSLEIKKEIQFPHSLGLLYSAFTEYIGFRVNYDEYKVMGLAPYGSPIFRDTILDYLIDVKDDGSFWMDQSYFNYATGFTSINGKFGDLFGEPRRAAHEPITQFHMDIARSVQAVTEDIVLRMAASLSKEFGRRNLCLAGGVAQNSVINGMLARSGNFDHVWIQPAAGDSGGSLGAALAYWHLALGQPRTQPDKSDDMQGACLGPAYTQSEIEAALSVLGADFEALPDEDLFQTVAKDISTGKVAGWFDGRMEFGARALGSRSILGDPRSETMQSKINLQVKGRESFRPFAPAVLAEHSGDWFALGQDSPYMAMVAPVAQSKLEPVAAEAQPVTGFDKLKLRRSVIPAVTHVDCSARIQTVTANMHPRFHALISAFFDETGCPMLLNTSFNGRDEPIVCTPEDAYRCFSQSGLDLLVCGNCIVRKDT
ncbi:carbamoyltransferase [Pontixanthobacter aestiaquae]|uniref:Carbamoyltransferase n=1 Tax=Pontixanthobacter aestiaquae TaxID=1509367 RepID=A0A844Z4J3_9SPHN|nr:carbamoyltransferase [Pontixanthobacter aestiaquae]MDN3647004.1 carbamoyltransferase [Pontixanthobacter aestiaquae]MXO82017.1 hypothetical protein [Pontixanthobacter aestiaquae]